MTNDQDEFTVAVQLAIHDDGKISITVTGDESAVLEAFCEEFLRDGLATLREQYATLREQFAAIN